ncbi:MAG: sigma-70 family RNA polymerase sigma factor [Chitinophagaceae bacterium]|jgi:RNA polymerase sigma-70 factor (ECF subfamily)|nr:sigma-70 family RNA polymerase sigma factor [Chitinophagaceae bacterium]MCU0403058.1 sigma-70 family RNA polymerase sigma factor [Chitinophagaceae bacterium]
MATYSRLSDNELIASFYEGDIKALEFLINRYKDRIYTSILFLVKDKYLAEDMFQDVFIKIIDTIRQNRYNDEGKFLSWALRIAHNLCVDHFRKVKRSPSIRTTEGYDIMEWIHTPDDCPERKLVRTQSYDRVRRMLDLLPEEQREVIVLRHYGNMSFKEIAGLTNTSINTALGRMRYGLINLRKMMSEKQISL